MLLPKHQATSCRRMQRKLHSGISCNLCTPTFCLPGWRICWKLFTYWLLSSRRSWYLCLKLRLLDTSYDKALFFTCFSLCQKWFRLKFVGNILFFFSCAWNCHHNSSPGSDQMGADTTAGSSVKASWSMTGQINEFLHICRVSFNPSYAAPIPLQVPATRQNK